MNLFHVVLALHGMGLDSTNRKSIQVKRLKKPFKLHFHTHLLHGEHVSHIFFRPGFLVVLPNPFAFPVARKGLAVK